MIIPDAVPGVAPLVTARMAAALAAHPDRSPLLVVDLDVVAHQYMVLRRVLPTATVYYAIKANPDIALLQMLVAMGSSFDVASIGEVRSCLEAGAPVDALSYGNTVKKRVEIAEAYALGVRTFAFDCDDELDKLVDLAPGSTVFCRVLSDGVGAAWPLSRKFGCTLERAAELLRRAHGSGLSVGVSFHVGSQQFDPSAWDRALADVAGLRAALREDGVELEGVNLGGGLPGSYIEDIPSPEHYGAAIEAAIQRHLGPDRPPQILIEPGRFLVADAGVLRTEVVTVGTKSPNDERRWVYLDVGVFTGLVETMDEAIRYRIVAEDGTPYRDLDELGPVILAGPTCDSADILYESTDYRLPLDLRSGDRLLFLSLGAYSTTYSTVGFNGFDPLDVEILPRSDELAAS
jgi:ornithine decarboxylase